MSEQAVEGPARLYAETFGLEDGNKTKDRKGNWREFFTAAEYFIIRAGSLALLVIFAWKVVINEITR